MAIVPQITILITDFFIPEPPVLAETAPRIINDTIVKPYKKYSMFFTIELDQNSRLTVILKAHQSLEF